VAAAIKYTNEAKATPPTGCPAVCTDNTPECNLAKNLCQLKSLGLPIGWSMSPVPKLDPSQVLGWLLTAIAVSLGAPFWFDLLNKFIVIRGTVKPKEKSPEEKSKD